MLRCLQAMKFLCLFVVVLSFIAFVLHVKKTGIFSQADGKFSFKEFWEDLDEFLKRCLSDMFITLHAIVAFALCAIAERFVRRDKAPAD